MVISGVEGDNQMEKRRITQKKAGKHRRMRIFFAEYSGPLLTISLMQKGGENGSGYIQSGKSAPGSVRHTFMSGKSLSPAVWVII